MAAYIGSSLTGGLPAAEAAATMQRAQGRRGEQRNLPPAEPYAIPRDDTIECLTPPGLPANPAAAWWQIAAPFKTK